MSRKLLFLDFDGVLNDLSFKWWLAYTKAAYEDYVHINPMLAANLAHVLHECPDVDVVISSSWRYKYSCTAIGNILFKYGIPSDRIVSMLSVLKDDSPRGARIQEWRVDHKRQDDFFIILDDCEDMSHLYPHLLKTDTDRGLTTDLTFRLINLFDTNTLPSPQPGYEKDWFWNALSILKTKMSDDEAVKWMSRENEDFHGQSPIRWVGKQISETVSHQVAWERVINVIKRLP